jgi:glycine hydroxymethyltransferase
MIICGASAYPADYDYAKFREIADSVGALLMADIAHTSGLIASKLLEQPFEHCDVAIAALAVQMKEVATPEFKAYSQQVILNAQALANSMMKMG